MTHRVTRRTTRDTVQSAFYQSSTFATPSREDASCNSFSLKMPGKTISVTEMIANGVSKIFDQSQNTTANHQKNRVALHKLHKEAAEHVESVQNGKGIKLVGERAFESTFIEMVNHILQVKKGVAVADRAVKFIGGYVMFLNDKGAFCSIDFNGFIDLFLH